MQVFQWYPFFDNNLHAGHLQEIDGLIQALVISISAPTDRTIISNIKKFDNSSVLIHDGRAFESKQTESAIVTAAGDDRVRVAEGNPPDSRNVMPETELDLACVEIPNSNNSVVRP
jgi:hypothetical protein